MLCYMYGARCPDVLLGILIRTVQLHRWHMYVYMCVCMCVGVCVCVCVCVHVYVCTHDCLGYYCLWCNFHLFLSCTQYTLHR